MMKAYDELKTPIGCLTLVADARGLSHIHFPGEAFKPEPSWQRGHSVIHAAKMQLSEYFTGNRQMFDVLLSPQGTSFQRQVWRALLDIPYGVTTSYGEIAQRLGRPRSSRAVGAANGRNPLPIIVPCHRVIGANGRLTGYAGGLTIKSFLLGLESQHRPHSDRLL